MARLVLMRHGESTANAEDCFGGWQDVPLTDAGITQARAAGTALKEQGIEFGAAHASVLRRATHSCWHLLDAMNQTWVGVRPAWRLNERHYGALEGMRKVDAIERFGAQDVKAWRRSFLQAPPELDEAATEAYRSERRYAGASVPRTESLRDLQQRVEPFWTEALRPALNTRTDDVLVVSHGNTLRALRRLIEGRPGGDEAEDEIPVAMPIVYRL